MDVVSDTHFNISAEEMLEKAKASAVTERDITMKRSTKRNIIGQLVASAAACLIISGTAASAMGYGPLGDSFRKFFGNDETTAEIIDEGHYSEIDQAQTDGLFDVVLDSVTGDQSSPKLLFDVTVNDETLAANNDRIQLFAYILSEDCYNNRLDEYGMWDAYGERDPEVSNLYHVCMDGPAAFMINEEEVVAAVKQISFDSDPVNRLFDYDVDMEYRFTVPKNALKESYQEFYTAMYLNSGNIEYKLNHAEYGSYESLFQFNFEFLGTALAGGETDYYNVCDKFDEDWHRFAKTFVLTVDGTDYTPQELGYSYCDTEGEAFEAGTCSTWMTFPGIDYTRAESITLTAGGEVYTLK